MRIAFIIGCARSGTSILGELLGAHHDVAYKHEADSVWDKAGLGINGSHRLTEVHATSALTTKIHQRFKARLGQGGMLIEKSPRNTLRVPFLRAVFPEAKIIHIVRDGRDVACSLLPGIGGDRWRHLRPPNWRELQAEDEGLLRCAKVWRDVVSLALEDLEGVPHCLVRYEQLVRSPRMVTRKLLDYLELDDDPAVVEFSKRITDKTDGYQPQKQRKWFQADHHVRIGRWKANMTQTEAAHVSQILFPTLRRLGYEVKDPPTAAAEVAGGLRATHSSGSRLWRDDPIVIGAIGGSGTRVVAAILRECGVYLGVNVNAAGDAEELTDFFDMWTTAYLRDPGVSANGLFRSDLRRSVSSLLADVPQDATLWGWKHPRSLLLLPAVDGMLPHMKFVHVVRDGRDMACSQNQKQAKKYGKALLGRKGVTRSYEERSIAFWSEANLRAASYAQDHMHGRYMPLRYEDLCLDPVPVLANLASFLGLPETALSERARLVVPSSDLGRWQGLGTRYQERLTEAGWRGLSHFKYMAVDRTP
jgi:hypothetical protein